MRATTWFEAINDCQQKGQAYVIVTVLAIAGSTPREAGCKMVVTGDDQFDTIGGGHLEFETTQQARELLASNQQTQKIVSYPLSSRLGQCCGGAVKVFYEVHVNHHQHVAIFGAGHVAQSLVPILAQLPLQISWVDNREQFFDKVNKTTKLLANVNVIDNDDPTHVLENLPTNTWVIILTHNHQLDYELVECALKHTKLAYVGMIGSKTKAKRFVTKLAHRGFSAAQIACLVSPIGDTDIPGKRPVEVSVSISAQLIRLLHHSPQAKVNDAPYKDSSLDERAAQTNSGENI